MFVPERTWDIYQNEVLPCIFWEFVWIYLNQKTKTMKTPRFSRISFWQIKKNIIFCSFFWKKVRSPLLTNEFGFLLLIRKTSFCPIYQNTMYHIFERLIFGVWEKINMCLLITNPTYIEYNCLKKWKYPRKKIMSYIKNDILFQLEKIRLITFVRFWKSF